MIIIASDDISMSVRTGWSWGHAAVQKVSVRFYIEAKCRAYNPPSMGSNGPQHLSPLLWPGGKFRNITRSDEIASTILGDKLLSFVNKNACFKDQLTDVIWPALNRKSMISFCLDAKIYKGELRDIQRLWAMAWATKKRRTLAITLNCILNWGIEKLCSRTYRFFVLKNRINLEPTILQNCQDEILCRVDR